MPITSAPCAGWRSCLADGSIIRTGGGAFGRCPTWNTHKWGVGPYIEGLFSQSNFGIVVKAGIWLFPEPESYCAFTFDLARDEDFPRLVDMMRELTLAGLLTAGVHMINDVCALSVLSQYPPGLAERVSRLPDDVLARATAPIRRVELELWRRNSRHEGVGEKCPAPAEAATQGHGAADLYHRPDCLCRDPGGARDHGLSARARGCATERNGSFGTWRGSRWNSSRWHGTSMRSCGGSPRNFSFATPTSSRA